MTTHTLEADRLRNDPRIVEAKRLVQAALVDHQSRFTAVRPPLPGLAVTYTQALHEMSQIRGQPLWYPYLGSGLGRGPFVELSDGSIKIDLVGGIGVQFGHALPEIIDAAFEATLSDLVLQGNLQQNRESLDLMKRLVQVSGLDHCFLTTSGAMAGENALKIAFQNRAPANRILAFARCFAGRSCTMSQITDRPAYREGLPPTLSVDYVPFFNSEQPEESLTLAMKRLSEHLRRYPGQHAAMIMELIQGEGGLYPGHRDFFVPLAKRLKEAGITIIFDEVQTFGRTESLFAFQHYGLHEYADIVMIGKLAQVCATLFRKGVAPKAGLLSQTFTSSTAAIRASNAVLDLLQNGGYFGSMGRNAKIQAYFRERLLPFKQVSQLLGVGTMIGFTPYDGDEKRVIRLAHALFDAGVIGFISGGEPMRMRFLIPAGAITEAEMDQALAIIETTLASC